MLSNRLYPFCANSTRQNKKADQYRSAFFCNQVNKDYFNSSLISFNFNSASTGVSRLISVAVSISRIC